MAPGVSRLKRAHTSRLLVGNGGTGYGDHNWGLYRDHYRDPWGFRLPASLLGVERVGCGGFGFIKVVP